MLSNVHIKLIWYQDNNEVGKQILQLISINYVIQTRNNIAMVRITLICSSMKLFFIIFLLKKYFLDELISMNRKDLIVSHHEEMDVSTIDHFLSSKLAGEVLTSS